MTNVCSKAASPELGTRVTLHHMARNMRVGHRLEGPEPPHVRENPREKEREGERERERKERGG